MEQSSMAFVGLVQNAALLLASAFLFDVFASRWKAGELFILQKICVGFILGIIGMVLMLTSWILVPGVVFDTRSVLIGITGLFFGTIPTVMTMAMTAALRIYQGGPGAVMGVSVILTSGLIGLAWRHWKKHRLGMISWRELLVFGAMIHVVMLALTLTLPREISFQVFSDIALPVLLIYPLGTALLGSLMVRRLVRERAEKALLESEERIRALTESAQDGIVMMDASGKVSFWNPAAGRIFGYVREEVLGRQMHELLAPERYHDAYHDAFPRFQKTGDGAAAGRTLQLMACRKDGWEIPIELSLSTMHFSDGWHAVGIIRDIAERKMAEQALRESEQRLWDIFNFLPDATFAIDLEGKVIAWNRAMVEMSGISTEDMVGKGDYEYALPFYGVRRPLLIDLVFFSDEEIEKKYHFVHKEGDTIFAEADVPVRGNLRYLWGIAKPLYDSAGRTVGAIESIRDITERKQTEDAREKLQAQLLQARKMESLGILAGGVAHDFNNLLQVMSGNVELLLMKKPEDHPDVKRIKSVARSIDRAAHLVRQLLLFSRKNDVQRQRVNLNHEVEDAARILERTIPKMVAIELHLDSDLWLISADPVQIEQVLLNLGSNAADAMPQGGRLTIETRNTVLSEAFVRMNAEANPGSHVLLTVSDTGSGMDRETLEHIFDPFYTTKEVGKGTGLGLASVYGIVKGHGGFILCYSEPGQGTSFRIYLPAMRQAEIIEESTASVEKLSLEGNETILVVDDEADIRELTAHMLQSYGYTVLCASSGEEALSVYVGETHIDIVVMDLGMPGMGGSQCLQELLNLDPQVKVLIASGYSFDGEGRRLILNGAAGFVGKPYHPGELLAKVRSVLCNER